MTDRMQTFRGEEDADSGLLQMNKGVSQSLGLKTLLFALDIEDIVESFRVGICNLL